MKKGVLTTQFNPDLVVINKDLPVLIPKKGRSVRICESKRKIHHSAGISYCRIFYEDCNLLNSPNVKVRKFGTKIMLRRKGYDFLPGRQTGKECISLKSPIWKM
jgi:hypothetical protein